MPTATKSFKITGTARTGFRVVQAGVFGQDRTWPVEYDTKAEAARAIKAYRDRLTRWI